MRLKNITVATSLFAALCAGGSSVSLLGCDSQTSKAEQTQTDAYTPELRAEIDAIKKKLAQSPTTEANIQERAMLLWRWLNAYALKGGYISVDMPLAVAAINMTPPPEAGTPRKPLIGYDLPKTIDRFLRELSLHDDDEGAFGELKLLDPQKAYPAHSYQTITQVYQVGSRGIKIGGGFMLPGQMISDAPPAQGHDPKADNYLTAKASRDGVRFAVDSYPLGGQHGGFIAGAKGVLALRVEGAELKPGDMVTFTYGDTSAGSAGFLVQSQSNERMPLPIYVDLTGNSDFLALPIQPIKIVGVEAHDVQIFAPSIVRPGEKFSISIRTQDKFGNRATSAIPDYEISLNGKALKTVQGGNGVAVVENLSLGKTGIYRYAVRAKGQPAQIKAFPAILSNPIWVEAQPATRIYWGETHAHSGFAEGIGTPDEFQRFARDEARLDFVGHSEHDAWLDDYEWKTLQEMSEKYNEEGKFLSFLSYEWSAFPVHGGHHNVFFRTTEGRKRVPIQTSPLQTDLYRDLAAANDKDDVLIIPHAHSPGDWRMTDNAMERLVEIASVHGSFEWFGNAYLQNDAEIGFTAASDDHTSHPGLALRENITKNRSGLVAVMASSLTRDNIFDMLRARRTYATTGARILMDVDVNGADVGTRAPFSPERRIKANISATAPLAAVSIIKNNETIWSKSFGIASGETSSKRIRVNLFSSSEPFKGYDSPRGHRRWNGSISVKGAKIAKVIEEGIRTPLHQYARQSASDPSRIEFSTSTRGVTEGFIIELAEVTAQANLHVTIEPVKEGNSSVPYTTRASGSTLAGGDFDFSVKELAKGPSERALVYDNFYRDLITMNLDDGKSVYDFSLDESDRNAPKAGDYYYVRVLQKDGHMAWSSPIWVGQSEKRQQSKQ